MTAYILHDCLRCEASIERATLPVAAQYMYMDEWQGHKLKSGCCRRDGQWFSAVMCACNRSHHPVKYFKGILTEDGNYTHDTAVRGLILPDNIYEDNSQSSADVIVGDKFVVFSIGVDS